MRITPRPLAWIGALALAGAALAAPAVAVPVVYTVQGTLSTLPGPDTLGIEGATLVVVATADTADAPVGADIDTAIGYAIGSYLPASLTAAFSNRPGGARTKC
jgi:hypothetical protein